MLLRITVIITVVVFDISVLVVEYVCVCSDGNPRVMLRNNVCSYIFGRWKGDELRLTVLSAE